MNTAQDLREAAINDTGRNLDLVASHVAYAFVGATEWPECLDSLGHRTFLLIVAEALDGGKPHTCKWTHDDNDGLYGTECGNAFEINDGTPKENQMAFCCYCGGTIKENRNE